MEEYRRKYLGSALPRTSYLDSLEKDKTVSELRQELSENKKMEDKFDDLTLEIVKLQKENKKLESDKASIEGDYFQKIKLNKARISTLKQEVLDCRESIEDRLKKVGLTESENQKLKGEVARIEDERVINQKQVDFLRRQVDSKEQMMKEVSERVQECRVKAKSGAEQCQKQSQQLQNSLVDLKNEEKKLKEDELANDQLRRQLAALVSQRQLWQKKTELGLSEASSLKSECALNKSKQAQLESDCQALEKENKRMAEVQKANRAEIRKKVEESRDLSRQVKVSQDGVVSDGVNLDKSRSYFEKQSVKEVELRKQTEYLQEVANQLSQTLKEEQQAYNRVIIHMRQSIQQDEQAIESLVKQATTLETMIN